PLNQHAIVGQDDSITRVSGENNQRGQGLKVAKPDLAGAVECVDKSVERGCSPHDRRGNADGRRVGGAGAFALSPHLPSTTLPFSRSRFTGRVSPEPWRRRKQDTRPTRCAAGS